MIDLDFGRHLGEVAYIVLSDEYYNVDFEAVVGGVNNEGIITLYMIFDAFTLAPTDINAVEFLGIPDYIQTPMPEIPTEDLNGPYKYGPDNPP